MPLYANRGTLNVLPNLIIILGLLVNRDELLAGLVLFDLVDGLLDHHLPLIVGLGVHDMLTESFDELKRELLKLGCHQSVAVLPPLPLLVNVRFFNVSGDKSPSIDLTSRVQTVEDNLELKGCTVDAVVVNNRQGEQT